MNPSAHASDAGLHAGAAAAAGSGDVRLDLEWAKKASTPEGEPVASEELLKDLNPQQRAAMLHGDGPLLIVAGAGSGKTAVLTRRVAHLVRDRGVPPFGILAITFTNKAAEEMRERTASLIGNVARKMWMGTFHSMFGRVLRKEAPRLGYSTSFTIYDSSDSERLLGYVLRDLDLDPRTVKPSLVHHAISRAKDELVGPEDFAARAGTWMERQVAGAYMEYQRRLEQSSAMDFDDLINVTVRIFREFPDVLAAYRARWQHVLVDEFQDTNTAQFELVRMLGEPDGNVCVVGDMDQSIYAFRGANYLNLVRFESAFPGARVVTLEQNYRSTQNILSAANRLIEQNRARRPKNLWTEAGAGELITRCLAENEHDEAAFVASEIERLRSEEGCRLADMAVFYRTNAQSRVLEEVFTRYGIPYRIVGGLRFYERREVKDLLAYLRVLVNPADDVSLKRVVNTPRRGIGDKAIAALEAHAKLTGITLFKALERASDVPGLSRRALGGIESFVQLIGELRVYVEDGASLRSIVEVTGQRSGYMAELEAERTIESLGRVENLEELAGMAGEFAERLPGATLDDLLAQIALVSEQDEYDPEEAAATFMTLHNAKGLEFPVVFITGLEEGVFPHTRTLTKTDELEEERRLAYVGVTRARERLYLTHAVCRSLWGGTSYNPPSRFLKEVPADLVRVVGDRPVARGFSRPFGSGPAGEGGSSGSSGSLGPPRHPDLGRAAAAWRVGQEVVHDRWGTGIITALEGSGEKAQATVWFAEQGEKRLLLAYAPLRAGA
ncbi:MAG TPA: UvrD-helicase domain-containing protein [Actinomycetota bacterium]|jgi:DNA helicase-2/ATP-dependent DNA helicase PcrA